MNRTKVFFLFFVMMLTSCGSSDNKQTITQSVEYKITAISAMEYTYDESILLSGTTMTITRNGGSNVNVGVWTFSLKPEDVSAINNLLYDITTNPAHDIVRDSFVYDAPLSEIIIDGQTYFHGNVTTNSITKYHEFSAYVRSLTQYIRYLKEKFGCQTFK